MTKKEKEKIKKIQDSICDFIRTIEDKDVLEYYEGYIMLSFSTWCKPQEKKGV